MPANYFEVLPDNTEAGAEATGEEGYSYEYAADGYDYNGGGADDQVQPAASESPPSSTPSSPPLTQSQHPPISESPAYIEQMKCWGDILQSQKDEKAKLEKQVKKKQEYLDAKLIDGNYLHQIIQCKYTLSIISFFIFYIAININYNKSTNDQNHILLDRFYTKVLHIITQISMTCSILLLL